MSILRRSLAVLALSFATLGAAFVPSVATAGPVVHAAVSNVNSEAAVELGLGYAFKADKFYVAPAIGIELTQGEENTRYRTQTQSNGTEVCRDSTNGQYSNKENCSGNTDGRGFVSLEAGYRVADSTSVGIGVRRAEVTSPYAVVNFGSLSGFKFRLAGGKDYASIGASLGF